MKLAARFIATAVLGITACVPFPPPPPPSRSRDAADPFVGCWQLQVGPYKPPLNLQGDEKFIVVPAALELTPYPGQRDGLALAALPDERQCLLRTGYWYPIGPRTAFATLTNGFTSLNFKLALRDGRLHGAVRPEWDFPRARQSAEVTATRRPCTPTSP